MDGQEKSRNAEIRSQTQGLDDGRVDVVATRLPGAGGTDSAGAAGDGRLVQDVTDVRPYRARFDRIGGEALPVRALLELIKQVMEGLE